MLAGATIAARGSAAAVSSPSIFREERITVAFLEAMLRHCFHNPTAGSGDDSDLII